MSPLTKTQRKALIAKVKTVLTMRRNGRDESGAMTALCALCDRYNVSPASVMEQGIAWLKRNSIAASMNGLV